MEGRGFRVVSRQVHSRRGDQERRGGPFISGALRESGIPAGRDGRRPWGEGSWADLGLGEPPATCGESALIPDTDVAFSLCRFERRRNGRYHAAGVKNLVGAFHQRAMRPDGA